MNNLVYLEYLNDYEFEKLQVAVENSFKALNITNKMLQDKTILIKACLSNNSSKDMAETTNPAVVRAIVDFLSNRGVKCIVADCPIGKHNEENLKSVYLNTGMMDMANISKCELNLNLKTSNLEMPNGVKAKSVKILDIIKEVDGIINVGKLKFDEELGYLGATSNYFGIIPGELKEIHLNRLVSMNDFNDFIIDLYEAVKDKVVVNVIDAVVCLEAGKTQRMLNCLAMSEDAYALDATMFDILKMKFSTTFLKQAKYRELFDFKKPYRVVGDKLEKFQLEDFMVIESDSHKLLKHNERYFKSHQMRVCIDSKTCKGCQICSKICPSGAILMKYDNNGELFAEIDYDKCIFCNKCQTACPYSVVKLKTPLKYKLTIKDVEKYNN